MFRSRSLTIYLFIVNYLKGRNFRGYLFSRINTDFLQFSLFYADFNGISEKSTFRGYLISRNQRKFAKLAKISTREN